MYFIGTSTSRRSDLSKSVQTLILAGPLVVNQVHHGINRSSAINNILDQEHIFSGNVNTQIQCQSNTSA